MKMRALTHEEKLLISAFASKLGVGEREQLIEDMKNATASPATPDGSRIIFDIEGYQRPPYRGQHPLHIEGRMLDGDGVELTVLLHADENGRLFELELIRWDSSDLLRPQWDTLTLQ